MGCVHAADMRASPTIITMKGMTIEAAPGAPVLDTPIMKALAMPSAHFHVSR